jgi:hypothetical protein
MATKSSKTHRFSAFVFEINIKRIFHAANA